MLSGKLAQTAIDVVMMAYYAALMSFYDSVLTLIGVAFAAINFFALKRMARWRVEDNMRLLQETGKVTGASIAGTAEHGRRSRPPGSNRASFTAGPATLPTRPTRGRGSR